MKINLKDFQKFMAIFIIAVISFSILSCSKDDEVKDNSIVGEWRLALKESDGSFWYCQYNFKSNGIFEVKDWSSDSNEPSAYEASGKYTTSESYITLDFGDYEETYRYTISGKELIIYDYEEDGPNVFYKL